MTKLTIQELTTTALLGVLLLISGSFKIPSPIAGGEFQLSAPIAVLICACFGFKRYIIAGVLASLLGLLLGMHNIINVLVQMVFRLIAGGTMAVLGTNLLTVALSGPLGTFAARLVLWQITGVSWLVLTAAAVPGMIFTAIAAGAFYRPAQKLLAKLAKLALARNQK